MRSFGFSFDVTIGYSFPFYVLSFFQSICRYDCFIIKIHEFLLINQIKALYAPAVDLNVRFKLHISYLYQ